MAFTKIQQKDYFSSGDATTHNVTYNSTPTPNNLLIIPASADGIITTPTGWTKVTGGVNYTDTHLYYKIAGVGEATTIAFVINAATSLCATALEYSGGITASPLDKSAANVGSGTTGVATWASGTTAATVVADELAIAMWGQETATGQSPSYSNAFVGITAGDSTVSATSCSLYVATKALTVVGTQTSTITIVSTNAHWVAVIATFKAAAVHPPAPRSIQAAHRAAIW